MTATWRNNPCAKGWAECPECGLDTDEIDPEGYAFCPECGHMFWACQPEAQ